MCFYSLHCRMLYFHYTKTGEYKHFSNVTTLSFRDAQHLTKKFNAYFAHSLVIRNSSSSFDEFATAFHNDFKIIIEHLHKKEIFKNTMTLGISELGSTNGFHDC